MNGYIAWLYDDCGFCMKQVVYKADNIRDVVKIASGKMRKYKMWFADITTVDFKNVCSIENINVSRNDEFFTSCINTNK